MERFKLEDSISNLYSTANDIKVVVCDMYDNPDKYDQDRIFNILYGLASLMEVKIEQTEDTYCRVFKLNQYRDKPDMSFTINTEMY